MKLKRYQKPIVIFLVIYTCFIIPFFALSISVDEPRFSIILPFDSMMMQIGCIFLLIPITGIIGAFLTGYILAPIFLLIYKNTIGFKMEFGIQDREKPPKFNNLWRGIFPSFLAINLALLIGTTEFGRNYIVSPEYLVGGMGSKIWQMVAFAALIPFITGVATAIFSPVWFLLDSGIVFSNKKKVLNKVEPIEVRSIGGWYNYLLKGYAGIGVIIAYILFLGDMLVEFENPFDGGFISTAILLPIMPVAITLLLIPSMILMDYTLESRRKYIRTFAKKYLKIDGPLEHPLDLHVIN
jgi:hypothetical protein